MVDEQKLKESYEYIQKLYDEIHLHEGNLDEAITELKTILKSGSESPLTAKVNNLVGNLYYDKSDYQNAEESFQEAVRIDKDFQEAYKNLGLTYYYQDKYDDALIQYKKAIELNPNTEFAIECLQESGCLYYEQEKYDDALTEYNKIIDSDVDKTIKSKTLIDIGNIYVSKRDNDKALEIFKQAKKLDDTLEDAHLQLAERMYDDVGEDEGLEQYKNIIDSYPNSELAAKAYFEVGSRKYDLKEYEEAEKNNKLVIEIAPNTELTAKAWNVIGDLFLDRKKYDKAIENYQSAIEINPNFNTAHHNLAYAYFKIRRHHEALNQINEAIRIKPESSENFNLLGIIFENKDMQKAIEAYKKSIELDDTNYWPHHNLGFLYEHNKINEKAKAIEEWINCLKYAEDVGKPKTRANNHLKKLGVSKETIEAKLKSLYSSAGSGNMTENSEHKISYDLINLSKKTYLPSDLLNTIKSLLEDKHQLIFYGVPGTGKTFVSKEFANYFTNCKTEDEIKQRVKLIQFHQSYSYEEFIEGIRPETVETSSGRKEISYPIKDGIFKEFCMNAEKNKNEKYLLIIDEVNRGNISKIFGELLYLLEYRSEEVTLPYSGNEFKIPDNVYIIGTMNTADRSIALVDYALRRRFYFIEFKSMNYNDGMPKADVLEKWLNDNPDKKSHIDVLNLFIKLNDKIKSDLDEHHQIGHSYFMIKDGILDEQRLKIIWEYNIMPLLKEYFFTKSRVDLNEYDFKSLISS